MLCAVPCCLVGIIQCIDDTWVEYLGPCVTDSLLKATFKYEQQLLAVTVHLAKAQQPTPGQHADATYHSCVLYKQHSDMLVPQVWLCQSNFLTQLSSNFASWTRYQVTWCPAVVMWFVKDQAISKAIQYRLQSGSSSSSLFAVGSQRAFAVLLCSDILQHSHQSCYRTFAP